MSSKTRIEFQPFVKCHVSDAARCYAHCMATDNPILQTLSITEEAFLPYATKTVSRMVGKPFCFVAVEIRPNAQSKVVGAYLASDYIDYMAYRKKYHEECSEKSWKVPLNLRIREAYMWHLEEQLLIEYGHVPRGLLSRGFVGVMLPEYSRQGIYTRLQTHVERSLAKGGYIALMGIPTNGKIIAFMLGPSCPKEWQYIAHVFYKNFRYQGKLTPLAHLQSPGFALCGMWYLDGVNAGPGTGREIVPRFGKPGKNLESDLERLLQSKI
eukprot:35454_1